MRQPLDCMGQSICILFLRHLASPEELGMTIEKETPHYTTNRDVIELFVK